MSKITTLAVEVVGANMSLDERYPLLCEIVKRAEHLQVRAVAVLFDDESWKETHETWTAFCRSEFGWDDSYASRMKKAAQMVLGGTPITNEAQARALAAVDPLQRNAVLDKARKESGGEPTASQIGAAHRESDGESGDQADAIDQARTDIDECVVELRAVLRKIKLLPSNAAGRWINMPHLVADLRSAADALKRARPHGPCDEDGTHEQSCLCGGTRWLPQHVLDRPRHASVK